MGRRLLCGWGRPRRAGGRTGGRGHSCLGPAGSPARHDACRAGVLRRDSVRASSGQDLPALADGGDVVSPDQ
eukprot:5323802-Alexandrium_andersonii.AAC.1